MTNDVATTQTESADVEQTVRIPASTRRALLTGAGAVGATVVLAACGTDKAEPTTPAAPAGGAAPTTGAAPTAGTQSGGTQSGGRALATKAQVPVGGGYINVAEKVVVTQPTEGTFKAFSVNCTHKGCPVSAIEGDVIVCKCHGSKFSVADGSVKDGPATEPLEAKSVTADGDNIVAA